MRSAIAVLLVVLTACSGTRSARTPEQAAAEPAVLSPGQVDALARAYRQVGAAFGAADWVAVAEGFQRALAINEGDDTLVYSVAWGWHQAERPDDAFAWLEKLAPMKSGLVPQRRDFPKLEGGRFDRVVEALEANLPNPHAPTAFTLEQRDLIAEGIAHDPKTGTFYVSSIHHRKVVAVRPDGAVADFVTSEQVPLMSTLGLRVDPERRVLWVASAFTPSMTDAKPEEQGTSALHRFDLETGRELARYGRATQGRTHLLNDIAVASDGTVYVTDSEAGEVLRLAPDAPSGSAFEVIVPSGTHFYPNGITLSDDGETLFFADFVNGITAVRLDTRERKVLTHPRGVSTRGFDGLYFHDGALVGVDNGSGPGRVMRLTLAPSHDRVVRAEVLEAGHPLANIPTTGVIANAALYLLVNSQLRAFEQGKILPWEKLEPVHVVRVPLRR